MSRFARPAADEYAEYYGGYVAKVDADDIIHHLKYQGQAVLYLLRTLSEEQGDFRYAPDKWSVKELIGHLIDTERIFVWRALWFARGGGDALPGMEPDDWAAVSNAGRRTMPELWREQHVARTDNLYLLKSLDDEAVSRSGIASGGRMTVRAVPWIIAGHEQHHLHILKECYGIGV